MVSILPLVSRSSSFFFSRTFLSILAVFNYAIVWMVSTRPPTSKSSRPFNNPLVTVPKAPITIGIIVTFMLHSFFNSLARSRYLSLFSYAFSLLQFCRFSFFCWLLYGLVFEPRLGDPFVYQSPTGVCACHFLEQVLGCAYTICWHGQI